MAENDASDILATALKEMDDIIKSNDVMITEMKSQQSTAPFSPALNRRRSSAPEGARPSLGSTTSTHSGGLPNGPIHEMTTDSNRSSPRAKPATNGASAGQEDKALALLSELRSCMSEVSGVREVFRDLSSENQVFLRQLVGELNPESAKSSSSLHTIGSGKSMSLHAAVTAAGAVSGSPTASVLSSSPSVPARPMMGTSGPIHRAAMLEEEKRSLQEQVSVLRDQVEVQQDRIRDLERVSKQTNVNDKLDMMAEISQQRVRIITLEREKKELEDALHDHKVFANPCYASCMCADHCGPMNYARQIQELRIQLLQHEKDLLMTKQMLAGAKAPNGGVPTQHGDGFDGRAQQQMVERMAFSMTMPAAASSPVPTTPRPKTPHAHLQQQQQPSSYSQNHPHRQQTSPPPPPPSAHYVAHQPPSQTRSPSVPQNFTNHVAKLPAFDPMTQSAYAGTSPTEEVPEALEELCSLAAQKASSLGELPTQQVSRPSKPPPPLSHSFKTPPSRHRNAVVMPSSSISNGHVIDPRFGRGHPFRLADDDEPMSEKKKSNLRRLFGRTKRGSQDLDPSELGDEMGSLSGGPNGSFQRGTSSRATAGPRLGLKWNANQKSEEFAQWDTDQVCTWLHELGLGQYVMACRRWIRHGSQLLQASRKDMEKELGLRSSLHLKKLVLAVDAMRRPPGPMRGVVFCPGFSATRWLDDVGLPQYKTAFAAASLDSRVLNSLTWDDLHSLKINVELHCLSLKRGIQVLRKIDFNLDRLRRRPTETSSSPTPEEVCLWSNHQVMEWLRNIDFPEFASNLRGSGIHGALMVLEPRFTADVLAALLNIPTSKTLLRRHLSTHFISLIGQDVQQRKREAETHSEPLTPYSKIKAPKKKTSFFTKRSRSLAASGDDDELVCPLGDDISGVDLRKIQTLTVGPSEMMIETNIDDLSRMSLIDYENAPSTNV